MSGKKYSDASDRFDRQKLHEPVEAVGLVKDLASANFDEAVDIAVGLGGEREAVKGERGLVGIGGPFLVPRQPSSTQDAVPGPSSRRSRANLALNMASMAPQLANLAPSGRSGVDFGGLRLL